MIHRYRDIQGIYAMHRHICAYMHTSTCLSVYLYINLSLYPCTGRKHVNIEQIKNRAAHFKVLVIQGKPIRKSP